MPGVDELRTQLRAGAVGATDGASLTLVTGRCVLGIDQQPNANTFLGTLLTDGPYLSILPGALRSDPIPPDARIYEIPVRLYIGFDRESDQTLVQPEKLVENLRSRWKAASGMSGVPPADSVVWDVPAFDMEQVPGVVRFELSVTMRGCG